jgi:hypothetical protein
MDRANLEQIHEEASAKLNQLRYLHLLLGDCLVQRPNVF